MMAVQINISWLEFNIFRAIRLRNTWRPRLIITIALAILGIVLAILALYHSLFPVDIHLELLVQSYVNTALTAVMEWISLIFSNLYATGLVIITGLLFWWRLGRIEGVMIAIAGLVSLINYGIKDIIGRPRPTPEQVQVLVIESNSGFPSSHAFFSIIFLGMVAYLLYTHLKSQALRLLSLVLLIMLTLLVGTSRIYLGVHWPSDVLGGYVIGGFFLMLLIWGYEWWKNRASKV